MLVSNGACFDIPYERGFRPIVRYYYSTSGGLMKASTTISLKAAWFTFRGPQNRLIVADFSSYRPMRPFKIITLRLYILVQLNRTADKSGGKNLRFQYLSFFIRERTEMTSSIGNMKNKVKCDCVLKLSRKSRI